MDNALKNKVLSTAAFYEVKALMNDLNSYKLSDHGRKAIISRLMNAIDEHSAELNAIMTYINDLIAACESYEEKLGKPQKLEKEFEDVAKKLNFPIVPAIDDPGCKNPNIETPFEDPVPDADINFIKEKLDEHSEDNVKLTKDDDPLPKSYINTFLHIDRRINDANEMTDNKKPTIATKRQKTKQKKTKTKNLVK